METKVKVLLVLAVIGAILSFVPVNEGAVLWIKVIVFIALLVAIYFFNVMSQLDKTIQVIINDVKNERRSPYREKIATQLKSFGEVFTISESGGEVALGVTTKGSVENIKKSIDALKFKIQHKSTACILRFTSLEAAAQMTVGITGYATAGSEVIIEGVKEKIKVGNDGGFSVKVPVSLITKYNEQGFIPAKCKKGNMEENIQITIPK